MENERRCVYSRILEVETFVVSEWGVEKSREKEVAKSILLSAPCVSPGRLIYMRYHGISGVYTIPQCERYGDTSLKFLTNA